MLTWCTFNCPGLPLIPHSCFPNLQPCFAFLLLLLACQNLIYLSWHSSVLMLSILKPELYVFPLFISTRLCQLASIHSGDQVMNFYQIMWKKCYFFSKSDFNWAVFLLLLWKSLISMHLPAFCKVTPWQINGKFSIVYLEYNIKYNIYIYGTLGQQGAVSMQNATCNYK